METTQVLNAPPGWYKDSTRVDGLRYWDGQQWTDHVAHHDAPAGISKPSLTGPILVAILIPLIGFIWGIIMLARGNTDGGLPTMIISVVAFVLWSSVLASMGGA